MVLGKGVDRLLNSCNCDLVLKIKQQRGGGNYNFMACFVYCMQL